MTYVENTTLDTKRLLLRPLQESDNEALFQNITHDKAVLEYFIAAYHETMDENHVSRLINYYKDNQQYCFAIVIKETNEMIGFIFQLNATSPTNHAVEVGYAIGRKYWNHGYVTEALGAMIQHLFESCVHKITCGYLEGNEASKRVMEKNNMIYEGKKIDEIYYHEKYYDVEYYYLINPNK